MQIEYLGSSLHVPDFLIVGASRSGTSALYTYLSRHPRIYMPLEKEPMFFCRWNRIPVRDMRRAGAHLDWVVSDLEDYIALFQPAGEDQILGEASTWYLFEHSRVICNLQRLYGERYRELKIIIMLRNPVARAWSQYIYHVSERREKKPFEEAVSPDVVRSRREENYSPGYDYLGFSRYYAQVKEYLENFNQVKVLIFEEFFRQASDYLTSVFDFLGVEPVTWDAGRQKINISGRPKNRASEAVLGLVYQPNALKALVKPFLPRRSRRSIKYRLKRKLLRPERMPQDLSLRLWAEYREEVEALERLLGRSLSLWFPEDGKEGLT